METERKSSFSQTGCLTKTKESYYLSITEVRQGKGRWICTFPHPGFELTSLISDKDNFYGKHVRYRQDVCANNCWYYIAERNQEEPERDRERKREGERKRIMKCTCWLVGSWVLWHINLCRLFNAKSIFM